MRTLSRLPAIVGEAVLASVLCFATLDIIEVHRVHAQGSANNGFVPVELSTVGLDGRTGTPIVVLREPESGSVLPIWVGPAEAQAIALSLHGVIPPRPMTHDLMAKLIAELHAQVD